MPLLKQQTGYCSPAFVALEGLFGSRTGILQANTGTLDALLSTANTPRSADGEAPVDIELFDGGKRREYRLYFEKRTACPSDLGACVSFDSVNFCEDPAVDPNNFIEFILTPDDLCTRKVASFKYNYVEGQKVCPMDMAQQMAKKLRESFDNYAISLNKVLWTLLARPYTVDNPVADACVSSKQFGSGQGGWLDINAGYNTAATAVVFQIMNEVGAVFPFFLSNWNKLLMANGFERTPIVVHGYGALYDYITFRNGGAFACCNDAGVDQSALAGQIDMFNFLEGRPRANNNAGVTQDTTLMWQPGTHLLLQPYMLGEELQSISNEAHERYQFLDTVTGLQFTVVRNREYCGNRVEDRYQVYHTYKVISKPLELAECLGSNVNTSQGINQSVLVNFQRCTPKDCAGNATWGPAGDPTAALNTFSFTQPAP